MSEDEKRMLSWAGQGRLWDPSVEPLIGLEKDDPLSLEVEVITGTTLSDSGILQFLSAPLWEQKRDRFQQLKQRNR